MPTIRNIIRLFLASPRDLAEERAIAQMIVHDLDHVVARKLGWGIDIIRWEDMIPMVGERPQQVVFDQADFEETDVFVGVLWNRFGSPSGKADSGTEEEFEKAYESFQKTGRPRIHLYFCQRPTNLQSMEELEQKGAVIAFRDRIKDIGLIGEYREVHDFERLFRNMVLQEVLTIARPHNQSAPEPQRSQVLPKLYSDMTLVPAGAFLAGVGSTEEVIDYDYLIDLAPVTNREYAEFLEETGYLHHQHDNESRRWLEEYRGGNEYFPDHPVTDVSWYDATTYAAWKGKRLPTSLEWEKAARGTDGRIYPWGNEFSPTRCNSQESRIGATTPVRHYELGKSPYGCYDMAGNVFEWVLDWATDPRFSTVPNSEKLNRGGSFNRAALHATCWYVESDTPELKMSDVGFRCVYVPPSALVEARAQNTDKVLRTAPPASTQ